MCDSGPAFPAIVLNGRRLEAAWHGPDDKALPVIVLLHEGLGCAALWRDVPERLAEATGFRVFAYSRYGYGRSDPAILPRPPDYMRQEALTVLPQVLDAIGAQYAVLVGHSDGGTIAAIHASEIRDPRIAGIVLIAAHFFVEDTNLDAIRRIRGEYVTTGLRARLAQYHTDPDNAFLGWSGVWLDPAFREFNIVRDLGGIAVPLLALQGADDPYGTKAQLDALTGNVRAALETHLLPGLKHAPHLEAKDTVIPMIAAFALTHLTDQTA